MKVHHLNCGTMRMPGAQLVCHVLLVEAPSGLVLIDTGFGLLDIADPGHRIGPYRAVTRPALMEEQTAIRQIQALGFKPADVRHILLTHGDTDHAGGLSDFPWAMVHVSENEERAIRQRPTWLERLRYNTHQWAHEPTLIGHTPGSESWRGFEGVTPLEEVGPQILLVPLPGHTRGHSGIVLHDGDRFVLHAGDAFYHAGTLSGLSRPPLSLRLQEAAFTFDRRLMRENQARLSELQSTNDTDLLIVNAHDPNLLPDVTQTRDPLS
jgi:glyoxylase-like metal-dependent hydrolase (beta-lactamase superfamily II)